MGKAFLLCAACAICLAGFVWSSLAAADKTGAIEEPGFVSLFDGKHLDGWIVMGKPQGWKFFRHDPLRRRTGGRVAALQ